MANAWAARIVPMLDFIARAICSKTSPDLRRQRTSAAIVLYLAMKGTVGLCRLWSAIRAGGRLAGRCTTRVLLPASVLRSQSRCDRLAALTTATCQQSRVPLERYIRLRTRAHLYQTLLQETQWLRAVHQEKHGHAWLYKCQIYASSLRLHDLRL